MEQREESALCDKEEERTDAGGVSDEADEEIQSRKKRRRRRVQDYNILNKTIDNKQVPIPCKVRNGQRR